ncbi:hypothetical protein [Flagellimonas algicola]|uniref:Phage integrase SAM-like domain-containing protein n=1 Tax=Flagellimonas algicola TaxID=2583815 RepID=A0ABY2WP25_9FLAO|nr:hypothetical protein [Allomuricauda algicola]TMU56485.1 hypothetical protein FGG15_02800 [Allomuricauda algicola]
MDKLRFEINFHRKRYSIYIDRTAHHRFKNKTQAQNFIKKFREVIHDNVLVLGNIYGQLQVIKQQHYQFFDSRMKDKVKGTCDSFEKSYHWIYRNWAGSDVQFTQINVSFMHVHDFIMSLKRYAQRNKQRVLLANLYAIEKTYTIISRSYDRDIQGLTDGVSYRTEEIKINPFKNGTTDKESLRKSRAS